MKNESLEQIQIALAELMRVIGDAEARQRDAAAHSIRLSNAMKRLSALQGQLGEDAPLMLRHYLERRSYGKALEFLQSDSPQK